MKNFFRKSICLLILLTWVTHSQAQDFSYKWIADQLQAIKKQLVPDSRVAILDFEIKDTLQKPVVLKGETDLPDAKHQILNFLTEKNIAFIDSIRLLPDPSLGEKTWALATLSVSNLRAAPDDASELVSQVMMGTPLKVLDSRKAWFRVQTPEFYIGWMDAAALQLHSLAELEKWKLVDRYFYNELTGLALDAPGKKGKVISDLVMGDLFEAEQVGKGFLKIKIPDGRMGYVKKSACISFKEWISKTPDSRTTLEVAGQMTGFPYLWGGTSTKGIDCSGFVKIVFYEQGIVLARDASQQARYGEPVDFGNISNLQPGDLLFFGKSAQRITHVGIYTGKGDFIHASGKVYISSIVPGDPKHDPKRNFVAARRIIGFEGNECIVRVNDHPWYIIKP